MAVGIYKKIGRTADFSGASVFHPAKIPEARKHTRDWFLLEMRKAKQICGEKNDTLICQ